MNALLSFALITCAVVAPLAARESAAQSAIPVRRVSAAEATSLLPMGGIESVRPLTRGRVLVNDMRFRQLLVLDSTLASSTVTIDSVSSDSIRYGKSENRLVAYLGDSTLFRDAGSTYFLVIDPNGDVAHRLIRHKPGEKPLGFPPPKGYDAENNPVYAALSFAINFGDRWYEPVAAPIARMNYATQREEPVAKFQRAPVYRMQQRRDAKGTLQPIRTMNPLVLADDWAVLSDGTIAIVHAKDYNVELVRANGKRVTTTKLPFVKRKLTDAEKLEEGNARRAEILLEEQEAEIARSGTNEVGSMLAVMNMDKDSLHRATRRTNGRFLVQAPDYQPVVDIELVPARQMLDYMPPFLAEAVIPDLDARVWIRTTVFTGSDNGEVLYDVVNNLGDHVERVAIPADRKIVGFGKNGVIYLKFREGLNKWRLERRRVLR